MLFYFNSSYIANHIYLKQPSFFGDGIFLNIKVVFQLFKETNVFQYIDCILT